MMGLPYENLSPRRIAKSARFDGPRFFFGYGCCADDTEHVGLTAEAIHFANGDAAAFRRRLASGLRQWFLAGPPGIGLATLKSCLKLCVGFPATRSGVRSAGNGPAMRATIVGAMVPPDNRSRTSNLGRYHIVRGRAPVDRSFYRGPPRA
jgi:ADP-ribosylglycohydrolase